MLTNREVILAKIESTYNTDPTPGATDAILVENLSQSNAGARMIERPAVRANIAPLQSVYGGRLKTITFDCEVKGSGSAGTAPEIDALLRACALGVTNVPATSDTYAPVSTGHESCTIYYYQDGKRTKITGCRGDVEFKLETGNKIMASFTMTGHLSAPTDTAIVTPTYDSTVPAALVSVAFSIGGYSAIINALSFGLGNTVATPPDISASDGYGQVRITKRGITGSFDPEAVLIATNDFDSHYRSGTSMALATGVIGGTAGNRVAFSMPATYYTDISDADRDGIRTHEMPFAAVESSGDDDISIAFT